MRVVEIMCGPFMARKPLVLTQMAVVVAYLHEKALKVITKNDKLACISYLDMMKAQLD